MLLRFGNMRTMEKSNERTTGVRQEACTSVEEQLGEQGDGKAAVPSAAPELPQLREALWLPSTFSCPFLPPASPTRWPGLTLLLKSPFLRNFCDPRLPILGPLHWWAGGGEWSQPPALLCLLGLYKPRMFQESTIKIRAVLRHNVFDSCSVTT